MSQSSKAGDMILKLSPELMHEDASDSLNSFANISSIPQSLPADNDTQDYQPLEANLSSVGNNFQSASDGGGTGMASQVPSAQSGHSNQPSNHHKSRPSNHKARWIILAILTLLLLGLALLWYRSSTQASQLRSAQTELQEALESSEKLQAKEVQVLADKIAKLRTELDEDIPQDIQAQYNKLLTQLQTLSKSSNSAVASLSTQLVAQLTNQAGEGIGLSSDGKTITNKGVLSVNSQSGNINIQGTPNQTTVTQNGSNITLGTSQDIASTASPTFNNQTLTGNQTVSGNTTTNGLTIQSSGTQNGYALCDASNNCGYSGAGSSYVQGGNSFGNPANLGTNDNQALNLRTNGTTRLTVDTAGNTSLTGNLSTPGSVSAGSLAGNGSGVTNVDALTLQGNGASYYTNASNLASGTLSDARLSSNIPLKNATNTFTGTNNFAGLTATGILQGGYSVCDTSNNCNYAPISGSGNYIQNQTATPQIAGFNISGNGIIGGRLGVGVVASLANFELKASSSGQTLAIFKSFNDIELLKIKDMGSDRAQLLVGTYFSTSSPNYSFSNDTDTGIAGGFSTDSMQFVTGGVARATINSAGQLLVGTSSGLGQLAVVNTNASQVGMVVRGASGQTADLFVVQDNAGATLAKINTLGEFQGLYNSGAPSVALGIQGAASSVTVGRGKYDTNSYGIWGNPDGVGAGDGNLTISPRNKNNGNGAYVTVGQRDSVTEKGYINLQAGYNPSLSMYGRIVLKTGSAGYDSLIVDENKRVGLSTNVLGSNSRLTVNASATIDNYAGTQLNTGDVSNKGLVIQGSSGQTADLQQWQNNTGVALSRITSDGRLLIGGAGGTNTPMLKVNSPTGYDVVRVLSGSDYTTNGAASHKLFTSESWYSATPGVIGLGLSSHTLDIPSLGAWGSVGVVGVGGPVAGGRTQVGVYGHAYFDGNFAGNSSNNATGGVFTSRLTPNVGDFNGSLYGVRAQADTTAGIQTGGSVYGTHSIAIGESGNNVYGGYFIAQGTGTNISLQATAGTASTVGLVAQGAAGQTANLQEWRDSAGVVRGSLSIGATPGFMIGASGQNGSLSIGKSGGGHVVFTGSGDGLEITGVNRFNVNGVVRANQLQSNTWSASGNAPVVATTSDSSGVSGRYAPVWFGGTAPYNALYKMKITPAEVDHVGLITSGKVGQTGDLLQARNSSDVVLAKIDASGNLTVKNATVQGTLTVTDSATFAGNVITFSNNVRGYNVGVAASATTHTVTFGTAHPDANYAVMCTPDWSTTCFVSNKTASGFTLNFGTAAPSGQLVDWFAVH